MTLTPAPARARFIILDALRARAHTSSSFEGDTDYIVFHLDKAGIGFTEKGGEEGWFVRPEWRELYGRYRLYIGVLLIGEVSRRDDDWTFQCLGDVDLEAAIASSPAYPTREAAQAALIEAVRPKDAPAEEMERQDLAAEKDGADSRAAFAVGDRVVKRRGDYTYDGTVVAVFSKRRNGQTRYVVEDDRGLLFIFSEEQLDRFPAKTGRST